MAKKVTIQQLLSNPIDYLYLFATEDFLSSLDANTASIIRSKHNNQKQLCNVVAKDNGSTLAELLPKISDAIVEQYGLTPAKILMKLAFGESVAGKNWAEGIYGVGAKEHTNFATGTDYTVDANSGKILYQGVEVADQTPTYKVYKGKTYVSGYCAKVTDSEGNVKATYNSAVRGTSYKKGKIQYNSATYGIGEEQCRYDGSKFTPTDADSVWQAINTYMPQVQEWIEVLVNIFVDTKIKLINAQKVQPSQAEWMYYQKNKTDFSKVAVIGAALVGGYLLLSDKKK